MKKALKHLTATLVAYALTVSVIAVALGICMYYVPYDYYSIVIVILALVAIVVLVGLMFYFTVRIKGIRDSGELKSAEILGSDVKEAYSFGQVGMLVTNDTKTILWYNEYLDSNGFRLVDHNIKEISEKLLELDNAVNPDTSVTIQYGNRSYEVKLIKDANLYIFRDRTDYELLKASFVSESPAMGFVQVDNYFDISTSTEEGAFAGLMSDLRKLITEFANTYDIYVRQVKADTYLMISSYSNYKKMAKDGFALVDQVRTAFKGKITLSAGFAYNYPDFPKLAQAANESLEVALSRGGDQTTISPAGENMVYVGGKTESKGTMNKAKMKVLSQSFITIVKKSSNVLVLGHYMADFDSIGACLGVVAICQSQGIPCKIVYGMQNVEKKCRVAFANTFSENEIQKLTISYNEAIDNINEKTLVVAVDVNQPDRLIYSNFVSPDSDTKVAIIDHHRRVGTLFRNIVFNGIDSSASSACELVAAYINASEERIPLPKDYATFMLAGTAVDTDNFKNKVSAATFEAMAFLKTCGADTEKVDEFVKEDYEQFQLKTKFLNNAEVPFTGIFIATDPNPNELVDRTLLAMVSQRAMAISGFDASFTIGRVSETEIGISARSNGTVNVEMIMRKMGGGGHFAAAAAAIPSTDIEKVKSDLIAVLQDYLPANRDGAKVNKEGDTQTLTMPSVPKTNSNEGGNVK